MTSIDDQILIGTRADEVEYKGKRFVVYKVDEWDALLRHTKALLIRKQEQETED